MRKDRQIHLPVFFNLYDLLDGIDFGKCEIRPLNDS